MLEAELEVDRQAVILAPSILHYVIRGSHFVFVHLTGEDVVLTSVFLPGIKQEKIGKHSDFL